MDTRTYQEVKKDLEARRQARRARVERFQLKEALEFAEIERLEKINQTRKCLFTSLREAVPQKLTSQPRRAF
jgi:UDP-N-acetylglucosamine transferase subunit ALG13